jgi:hypothetical protein
MLLYLLDANVLIDANRDYYPIPRVPPFWEWLIDMGNENKVKVPLEIYEEIKDAKGDLPRWLKLSETKSALLLREDADVGLVQRVFEQAYVSNPSDDDVEKVGRDPFLIAYALSDQGQRCVVTTEVSKPKKTYANRHIPDVCADFGIPCCNTFDLVRDLDFRIT